MEISQSVLKSGERAMFALRGLYSQYGYSRFKMSKFEEYDFYAQSKNFLRSDSIITFTGSGGRLMALRPDVTLSIVKNVKGDPPQPVKVYYNENVYRTDGGHAFREIMQSGLESIGDLTQYDIAEVVLLAATSLQLLGDRWVLDISHMGMLAAVLEDSGLNPQEQNQAMEYLHRKNYHQLKSLCSGGRAWEKLSVIAACRGGREALEQLQGVLTTAAEQQAFRQLKGLWEILEASGCASSARLDFSVGNNMRYYSGVVFRGYLEGIPASILSGGQYDKLPRKMGRNAKAIGFAIYLGLLDNLIPQENAFDVDTLILHDGTVEPKALMAAAEAAAKEGTVLVTRQLPQTRSWNRLVRLEREERSE